MGWDGIPRREDALYSFISLPTYPPTLRFQQADAEISKGITPLIIGKESGGSREIHHYLTLRIIMGTFW
jgi:hypothetical protein